MRPRRNGRKRPPPGPAGRGVCVLVAAALLLGAAATSGCRRRRVGPNDAYLDPRVTAEQWNHLFTASERELSEKRDLVIQLAGVKPGMTIADVGAGTGVFTRMLSDAVGPTGRVYAEEVIGNFAFRRPLLRDDSRAILRTCGRQGGEGRGFPSDSAGYYSRLSSSCR